MARPQVGGLQARFIALAESVGWPDNVALFCRPEVQGARTLMILLLTPAAAGMSGQLGVGWTVEPDPSRFRWQLLAGSHTARDLYQLYAPGEW